MDYQTENEDGDTCSPIDTLSDNAPLVEDIICDQRELGQLFRRLEQIMSEALTIGRLRQEGMTDEAIAKEIGIKRTTFRSRLEKAKEMLTLEFPERLHASLIAAVADDDVGHEQASGEELEKETAAPEPQQKAGTTVVISANGGRVNVRSGNGTQYARISTIPDGTAFAYVATAENGWHAVETNGQVGWVSGEYAKRV